MSTRRTHPVEYPPGFEWIPGYSFWIQYRRAITLQIGRGERVAYCVGSAVGEILRDVINGATLYLASKILAALPFARGV